MIHFNKFEINTFLFKNLTCHLRIIRVVVVFFFFLIEKIFLYEKQKSNHKKKELSY